MQADVSTKRTTKRSLMRELYAQVVGSDLESGYTFMYTWLANQFGHFMIGFAGTLAWLWAWSSILGWQFLLRPQNWTQLGVVGVFAAAWLLLWILKEILGDIIPGLRDLREAREKRIKDTKNWYRKIGEEREVDHDPSEESSDMSEQSFEGDLYRDSRMDGWFYFCGVFTALMMLYAPFLADTWQRPWLAGGLPLLTFLFLLFVSRWVSDDWLWRNIAFDKARLPFVSRFALTKRPFEKVTREGAINFALKNQNSNRGGLNRETKHVVIIGPPKSGRTTAAVALGVEALLRTEPPANIVRYITLPKLLDRIVEGSQEEATPAYPPEEADLLIVDDVGAQTPPPAPPLLTYTCFAEILEKVLETNDSLRAAGKTKRVIWVVGDNYESAEEWTNVLNKAFGPFKQDSKPYAIFLTEPIPRHERRRPMQHAKGATHVVMRPILDLLSRRTKSGTKTL